IGHLGEAVQAAVDKHFPGVPVALVNADAGSGDGTPDALARVGLPTVLVRSDAPPRQPAQGPLPRLPRPGGAPPPLLRGGSRRPAARGLGLRGAAATPITDEWPERLPHPIREERADWVAATYARHRYDGTITRLMLSPLVRALYGRRLHQPLGGQQALS